MTKNNAKKPKIAVLLTSQMKKNCIADKDFARLNRFSKIVYQELNSVTEEKATELMQGVDGVLTGWGTPNFTEKALEVTPNLKIIAHSAGSIKCLGFKMWLQVGTPEPPYFYSLF